MECVGKERKTDRKSEGEEGKRRARDSPSIGIENRENLFTLRRARTPGLHSSLALACTYTRPAACTSRRLPVARLHPCVKFLRGILPSSFRSSTTTTAVSFLFFFLFLFLFPPSDPLHTWPNRDRRTLWRLLVVATSMAMQQLQQRSLRSAFLSFSHSLSLVGAYVRARFEAGKF